MAGTSRRESAVDRIRERVEEKAARRAAAKAAQDDAAENPRPGADRPPSDAPSEKVLPGVDAEKPTQIPLSGWKQIADEEDAPSALQSEYRMREVVLAAAIQGAIFAATKAAIDRAGARGFTKLTGTWPGD